jgi:hypothetical protein
MSKQSNLAPREELKQALPSRPDEQRLRNAMGEIERIRAEMRLATALDEIERAADRLKRPAK